MPSPSLTSSFSQRKHSGRKGQRKTFYEGNDVAADLMLLVLFHLPEDGGWKQSVDGTVDYRLCRSSGRDAEMWSHTFVYVIMVILIHVVGGDGYPGRYEYVGVFFRYFLQY